MRLDGQSAEQLCAGSQFLYHQEVDLPFCLPDTINREQRGAKRLSSISLE